jgi:flagellar motor switch protein FliN/FliY
MTTNQAADRQDKSLAIAFSSALAAALTEASKSNWMIAALPDAAPASDASEPAWIKLTLHGSLCGDFLLEFSRAEAASLTANLSGQAAEEFGAEQANFLLKLMESAASKLRSALEKEYGEFTIKAASASEPSSDFVYCVQVTLANEGGNRISIETYLSSALTEALALHAPAEGAEVEAGEDKATASEVQNPEQINLNMVMNVELNVTLRFGQRHLTLREVLELTSGSVVELDRQVEEPIELILNNRVIARGEAVVIDGNYGLRVTEVLQPASFPGMALGAEVEAAASEIMRQKQKKL